MGNILELCSAKLYPDPKIYLGFTMCLTRDYKDIPDRSLVEDCALEHGMDFDKLNACTVQDDGGYGMGMLRDSVRRSTEVCEVGVAVIIEFMLTRSYRPVSQNLAQSDSTKRYSVYVMGGSGRIAQEVQNLMILFWLLRSCTTSLDRFEYIRP